MLNSSIARKVLMMNDIQNKKIVQDNDLIVSVAKMDKTPMKFFELAVASLDIKNIPADRTVHVSKELLYSFFDAKSENKHTRFKDAVLTVHEQAVFLMRELNERKGKYEYQVISPLERTSWNDYEDIVSFKFTESIFPYLIDLKGTYTQYLLSDIAQLNSKYSIIIYKWLSMNYNQYDYYNAKGGRREKQLNEYKNPIIPIEELRRITDTEKEYLKFSNFEARVLKKAVEEINQFTVLNATYEKIKKGNRIGSIQFHITKKQIAPNPSYKIGDSVYEAQQAEKEQNQITLFAQAMQSQYTTILMENMLIGYKDMQDIELMASLQEMVYPLYDELKTLRGLDGVRNHLEYVSRKQIGYSKTNIVKYLKTAITQYLPTVKMMDMDNRV